MQHRAPGGAMLDHPAADADLIARWERAGRPAVPLVIDIHGRVHATSRDLPAVLHSDHPGLRLCRETVVSWVEAHC